MTATKTRKPSANGTAQPAAAASTITVPAPNMRVYEFGITGITALVTNKFSEKARQQIKETQEAGTQAKSKKVRNPKDFKACFEAAIHRAAGDGWPGIPAGAFRSAMIDACRLVNFKMTIAKLSIFILADGTADDGYPLVQIHGPDPIYTEMPVRNDNGSIDLRARPMWEPGWKCRLRVQVDGDQFSLADTCNLLKRAGQQVGVGEGRPGSKDSHGMGWGRFDVDGE